MQVAIPIENEISKAIEPLMNIIKELMNKIETLEQKINPVDDNKLLSVDEVAKLLNIGKSTIWHKVKNNSFPKPIKIGNLKKWRYGDIKHYITANSV